MGEKKKKKKEGWHTCKGGDWFKAQLYWD